MANPDFIPDDELPLYEGGESPDFISDEEFAVLGGESEPAGFFGETLDRIKASALASYGNIVGGIPRAVAENPILNFLGPGFSPANQGNISRGGKTLRDQMLTQATEIENQRAIDTSDNWGVAQDFLSKGLAGATKFIPGMMAGPYGLTAQIGAETFGDRYSTARDKGYSPTDSTSFAAVNTGVNVAPLRYVPKSWEGGRYITAGPKTALTLQLAGALDSANKAATEQLILEDSGIENFDLSRALDQTWTEVKDNAVDSLATGLVLGYGGGAGSRLRKPDLSQFKDIGDVVPIDGPAADMQKAPEVDPVPPAEVVQAEKVDLEPAKPVEVKPVEKLDGEKTFPDPVGKPVEVAPEVVDVAPGPIEAAPETVDNLPEDAPLVASAQLEPTTYLKGLETVEVPLKDIRLSEDVPQFKKGANKKGVVEPLKGKFKRLGVAPIILWRRLNGQLEIITGRHRFDLAQRSGENTIPSQIVDEASGFTREMAQTFDAEANIRDEKGTIEDYVTYFRHARPTEEAATEAGLLSRAKGLAGFRIGTKATEPVYAKWAAGKLSTKHAEKIAEAAPNNESLQLLGVKLAGQKKSPEFIYNRLAYDHYVEADKAEKQPMLPGMEAIRQDSETITAALSAYQKQLDQLIKASSGAAKYPDSAKRAGVDVTTPERTRELVRRAQLEQEYWNEWAKDPEARDRVLSGDFPKSIDHLFENLDVAVETPDTRQRSMFGDGLDESGFIRLDMLGGRLFEKAGEYAREKWQQFRYAPEQITDIIDSLEKKGIKADIRGQQLDPAELFLRGRIFGRDVPGASAAARVVRKHWARPKLLAKKDPGAAAVWENRKQQYEWEAQNTFRFYEKAAPFFDLLDQSKVSKALFSAMDQSRELAEQGKKLVVTPEKLKAAGLSDKEVQAYQSVRSALDDMWKFAESETLETVRRKTSDPDKLAEKEAEIRSFFESKRASNYVPIVRYGDFFVFGRDPETGAEFYNLYDSQAEQREAAKNLAERKFTGIQVGKVRKPQQAAYENMPTELAIGLNKLIKDPDWKPDVPTDGFKTHLLRKRNVQGYELDLRRNLAQYMTSLAQWTAKQRFDPQQKELLGKIDPRSPVYQEMSDWLNYTNSAAKEGGQLRSMLGHYYLGLLNPASAALNSTQIFTVTYPELRRYTAKPWEALKQARQSYREYQKNPTAFAKKNPGLAQGIEQGIEQGMLGDEMSRELFAIRSGRPGKIGVGSWSDLSMLLNRIVERRNRVISFIAGYQNAPKGKDPVEFGKSFVEDTQFIYSRLNRPRIARGAKAPFYTFRLFGHNYWGNLKEAAFEMLDATGKARGATDAQIKAEYKAQAKALRGTLARYGISTAALGGGAALPFVSVLIAAAAANGIDLKKQLRDFVGNDTMADVLMYGPASQLFGVTLTGAVDPNNMISIDKGPAATAEKLAFGVVSDLYRKPVKAMESYNLHGDLVRAAEEVAPRTIRNVMQAARWAREGDAKDIAGRTVMKNPTPLEIALKGLSFNPTRYTEAIEKSGATRIVADNSKAETEKLLQKLAIAVEQKDKERIKELMDYAAEIQYEVDPKAILERVAQNKSPEYRAYKTTPKRARKKLAEVMRSYRDVAK